jgi:hypothetical protein
LKPAPKVLVPLVVIASILVATTPALAAPSALPVQDSPTLAEYAPAATASYVAWSDATAKQVYARPRPGVTIFQVSAAKGFGYNSSPVVDATDQIVYQQTNATGTRADLDLYDLNTKTRSKLPKKVDSKYWEWAGVASTQYVLFNRRGTKWNYMLLYNRSSHSLTQIARFKPKCSWCFTPTWVGSAHAVYDRCSSKTQACTPNVLTIGGSTVAVPIGAAPVTAYGGSLDEASGNLSFIQSSLYCGIFVSIERANITSLGTQQDLYDSPSGFDMQSTSLAPDAVSGIDLLFTDYDCMHRDSGTYEIDNIDAL